MKVSVEGDWQEISDTILYNPVIDYRIEWTCRTAGLLKRRRVDEKVQIIGAKVINVCCYCGDIMFIRPIVAYAMTYDDFKGIYAQWLGDFRFLNTKGELATKTNAVDDIRPMVCGKCGKLGLSGEKFGLTSENSITRFVMDKRGEIYGDVTQKTMGVRV